MRTCSECKGKMHQGYCIDGGAYYYCSDKCLEKNMTREEWNELYEEGGESYWTEWDEDDIEDEEEDEPAHSMYYVITTTECKKCEKTLEVDGLKFEEYSGEGKEAICHECKGGEEVGSL